MGSSYNLWDKRLDGDTLTRGQIGQFGNAIYAGSRGYELGGARTNLTPDECAILEDKFNDRLRNLDNGGFKLTPEHERFGWDWIGKNYNRALSLGITREMIETFQGFRFVGSEIVLVGPLGYRVGVVPMYKVLSAVGETTYSWSPWQSHAYA